MDQIEITAKAAFKISSAMEIIELARSVLLAQRLIGKGEIKLDLLPVVEHLLIEAESRHLHEAKNALKG